MMENKKAPKQKPNIWRNNLVSLKKKGSILDGVCKKECVHPQQFYFVEKKKKKTNPLKKSTLQPKRTAKTACLAGFTPSLGHTC